MFSCKFDFGVGKSGDGYIKVDERTIYNADKGYGFVFDKDSNGNNMINISSKKVDDNVITGDYCFGDKSDVPLRFDIDVPKMGTYNVKITVCDVSEDTKLTIFSENRSFMLTDYVVKKGEILEYEFSVNVGDIKRSGEERVVDRTLNIAVLGNMPKINAIEVNEVDVPTIYIAGDSTVTDQTANYPYNPQSTYCGWGQQIGQFIKKGIAVSNHAQSGLTTQTFMNSNWDVVKERIKKGDYFFTGFGHNDQKIEELGAFTGYYNNLKCYVSYCKEIGAIPVLCSPINRIIFEEDGSLRDLLGEYGLAVKAVAKEENVAFIDLLSKTTEYFIAEGSVRAWDYFWGDGENRDYTHTNDLGGNIVARFVAQGIVENKIEPLCRFIKTDEIDVKFPEKPHTVQFTAENTSGIKPVDSIGLVNVPKFKDISNLSNSDAIKELAAKGYIDSLDDDTFGADSLLTVQSCVLWAIRSAGIKGDVMEMAKKYNFVDENITDYNKPVTREELSSLIINSYNYRAPDRAIVGNIDNYVDRADISKWAIDYVRSANELGVLHGKTENKYMPHSNLTRGEAADIFYKLSYTK